MAHSIGLVIQFSNYDWLVNFATSNILVRMSVEKELSHIHWETMIQYKSNLQKEPVLALLYLFCRCSSLMSDLRIPYRSPPVSVPDTLWILWYPGPQCWLVTGFFLCILGRLMPSLHPAHIYLRETRNATESLITRRTQFDVKLSRL